MQSPERPLHVRAAAVEQLPVAVVEDLRERYSEAVRAYHNWSHVEALLTLQAETSDQLRDADAVLWAILFHDAIYDPRAGDNEERSAQLLETRAEGLLPPATLGRAAALVRATARHMPPDADDAALRSDAALFLDMDLSILAASADRFDRYEAEIRHEYAHVPDADFRTGRAGILRNFLARSRLFQSDWGFSRFEQAARVNLRRSLDQLAIAR